MSHQIASGNNRFVATQRKVNIFRLNADIQYRRIRREDATDLPGERQELLNRILAEHDEDAIAESMLRAVA